MASAAAVAADEPRSPIRNEIGEDHGGLGEITSGVYSKDEGVPGANGEEDSEDEELPTNPLQKRPRRAVHGDDSDGEAEADEMNLFGDDDAEGDKTTCVPRREAQNAVD